MSELRRWSEEGATEEEKLLLSASRREIPDASLRKRTLQVLGVGTVLTTASTAIGAAGSAVGLVAKIVGITVVVGGLAGGAVVWRDSQTRERTPAPRIPTAASDRPAPSAAVLPATPMEEPRALPAESAAAISVDRPDPPQEHSARTARAEASAPMLSQEVAALERAHKLAGSDPSGALRELDRYRARFPDGALSAEETVLRVQALLAAGDDSKARALADAFSAEHPESPYARRIEDLVRAKKK